MKNTGFVFFLLCFVISINANAQSLDFTAVRAKVDFSQHLRDWDGFGFNYVECAHTYDYQKFKQEYGGFSLLDEKEKQEIIDLVFGEDGLKVGLVKMFLDPLHQKEAGGKFDHTTTATNMLYFVKEGLKLTKKRGDNLEIITTLYGPPAYITKQKVGRGRDLDPAHKEDLANYMIDWVRFLKKEQNLPLKYLSLHNEGEDWLRWNQQGLTDWPGHDYNMYWSPELVVEYLKLLPKMLKKADLEDVKVTPGEPSNWYRFGTWGYSHAIANDKEALENMGIITSHGFYNGNYGRWFGEHKSAGVDEIRAKRPDIHCWVTSTSWSNMDAENIKEMHGNIYTTKVNGIIPWAGIQRPTHWVKGDPNPGSAFKVDEEGNYEVRKGYYFYKQITRAGQPGMAVAYTSAMSSQIAIIGFASNKTKNKDAVVVVNIANDDIKIALQVKGTSAKKFKAFRTTENVNRYKNISIEDYYSIGEFEVKNGIIEYTAPAGSVTTFFAE